MKANPESLAVNGTPVTRIGPDGQQTILIPLPRSLWRSCGRCDCATCKGSEGFWDTIAVYSGVRGSSPDTTWTVHAPEIKRDYNPPAGYRGHVAPQAVIPGALAKQLVALLSDVDTLMPRNVEPNQSVVCDGIRADARACRDALAVILDWQAEPDRY